MVKIKSTYKGILFSPSPIPHHSPSMVNGHSENKIRLFLLWIQCTERLKECAVCRRNKYRRLNTIQSISSLGLRVRGECEIENLCIWGTSIVYTYCTVRLAVAEKRAFNDTMQISVFSWKNTKRGQIVLKLILGLDSVRCSQANVPLFTQIPFTQVVYQKGAKGLARHHSRIRLNALKMMAYLYSPFPPTQKVSSIHFTREQEYLIRQIEAENLIFQQCKCFVSGQVFELIFCFLAFQNNARFENINSRMGVFYPNTNQVQ